MNRQIKKGASLRWGALALLLSIATAQTPVTKKPYIYWWAPGDAAYTWKPLVVDPPLTVTVDATGQFHLGITTAPPAAAATRTVCASGCGYTTIQAAFNSATPGDAIQVTSGYTAAGPLTIPGGSHGLTIKSSLIDTYPRNTRIKRNSAYTAKVDQVTIGDSRAFGLLPSASSIITTQSPHGFSIGDPVVVGAERFSAYYCGTLFQPPYDTLYGGAPGSDKLTCAASRVGFINVRTDTGLSNGKTVYFTGRTLPPPLVSGKPYYIVNFAIGNSWPLNADQFQVSLSPGGSPVLLGPNWQNTSISGVPFDPTGQDFNIVVPPLPAMDQQTMYIVGTPTPSQLQLSTTLGGQPVNFTQAAKGYNGSGFSLGFYITRNLPVWDITFDGIEFSPPTDNQVYYVFYIQNSINSDAGESHDIRILRCWGHGHDDQEDFPFSIFYLTGRDMEVGWSIAEGTYATYADTTNIGIVSTGNVWIHDNELVAATEGIFSGGNYPWFANVKNTTGIRVERNFIRKRLKDFHGLWPYLIDANHFSLQVLESGGSDCAANASSPNLGLQCYWWETDESSPDYTPENPKISRHVWDKAPADSMFAVTGGSAAWCPQYLSGQGLGQWGCGFLYALNGQIHMDYSFTGAVTCPSGVVCAYVSQPFFPAASSRLGMAMMDLGGFQSDFYMQNRHVYQKTEIESKYADKWYISGNVFQHQSNCDGGTSCQSEAIHWTLGGNGSGNGEPINSAVSTSDSIATNNIFRGLASGIGGTGETYGINIGARGATYEWQGFGKSVNNRIVNNLFYDIGSSEYTRFSNDGYLNSQTNAGYKSTQQPTIGGWVVSHNTAVDVRRFVVPNNLSGGVFESNVVVPYRFGGENPASGTLLPCPGPNCPYTHVAASTHIGVQDDIGNGWAPSFGGGFVQALQQGLIDSTTTLRNNILMNRPGIVYTTTVPTNYPNGTYLVQESDRMPGGLVPDPSILFQVWIERDNAQPPTGLNYRNSNFRLAPGMAATYPSADARVIGADIDEIEAITGPAGVDVEQGRAKFSDRSARQISAGSTTAVISYVPDGQSCAITIWPNTSYSGPPAASLTDSGAPIINGRVSVTVAGLSPGTYYQGKRICGVQGSLTAEYDILSFTTSLN